MNVDQIARTVSRQDPFAIRIGVWWVEPAEIHWHVKRVHAAIVGWLLQQLDLSSDERVGSV